MICICCGTDFEARDGACPKCYWDPDETHDATAGFDIGDIIKGRYKVKAPLGVGRIGTTLKCLDIKHNRLVVVKAIHPGLIPDVESRSRLLAGLKGLVGFAHPHVAGLLDAGKARDTYFYVREFLDGVSLVQLMADQEITGQAFPKDEALRIIEKLAKALTAREGIVHGLFSPAKIWVLSSKEMKVVDIGVVQQLPPAAVWHAQQRSPLRRFAAPELQDNRPPDLSSDVYALGVLLGEMLSLVEFDGRIDIFKEAEPEFSPEIEALIRSALSADPDARYTDALDLVSTLYDITGQSRTSMMPPDNTAVVPFKFLDELRSMSVPPPAADVLDGTTDDLDEADNLDEAEEDLDELDADLADLLDDDEGPIEITRQVAASEIQSIIPDEPCAAPPEQPPRPSIPVPMPSVPPPLPRPSVPSPPTASPSVTPPAAPAALRHHDVPTPVDPPSHGASNDPPERFEGINPRFLRAAAKLEQARISQIEMGDDEKDEEAWRQQLEESASGSVISFLPPDVAGPAPLKGFPRNQESAEPQISPAPRNAVRPPPLPPPPHRK